MPLLNGISTLLFFGLIVFVLLIKDAGEDSSQEQTISQKRQWIFILLFLGLLTVRLFRFPSVPGGLNQDGAMSAVDAKALGDYGTDRFGTFLPAHFRAWGYGQMSVLLAYLTAPFIKVLGLNKLAMRLPILLASLLGMCGVYGAVKGIYGKRTARLALLFTVINPWHFMQSRWALDCNLFPHMFMLGFCFLVGGIKQKRRLYFSMLFFALCMYCYGVSFYMVPFFLLAACAILFIYKKVTWKEIAICILIYFGISWPIYGTMLINFMKWETVSLPFVTMPFFDESIRSADILFFSEQIGQQFVTNLRALIRVVFWQGEDLPWNSIKDFGTMYQCTMPFVILGGILIFKEAISNREQRTELKQEKLDQKIGAGLLCAFWVFGMLTGIMINSVNVNRINIIFYINIIFAAVGISFTVRKWKKLIPVIGTIFLIHYTCFCTQYFTRWSEDIDKAFYGDFVRALEYARECESDRYCITPDTQYVGARQVTEILTLFVCEVDARYYQGENACQEERGGASGNTRGDLSGNSSEVSLEIPYEQKFRYANPWELGNPSENITYVIKSSDAEYFSQESFQVIAFGDYTVVLPLK